MFALSLFLVKSTIRLDGIRPFDLACYYCHARPNHRHWSVPFCENIALDESEFMMQVMKSFYSFGDFLKTFQNKNILDCNICFLT